MENISLEFIFSILGFTAGTASITLLVITFRKGPAALRSTIVQFTIGIVLITLAFLWDIVFSLEMLQPVITFDLHHLLMAISILFLVNATRKFYNFGR